MAEALAAGSDRARPPATPRRGLHLLPAVTVLVLLGPVSAGFVGTLAPAFGYMPVAGASDLSLAPFRDLWAWPGLRAAVRLSVVTGVAATALSLGIVVLVVAALSGTALFAAALRLLSPLLSVPHAAAAFGLAFLVAPSGWLARLASPWATGWERPPDLLVVQDQLGTALIAGLVVKEVPFLLLMTVAALAQIPATRRLTVARSLGYGRESAWLAAVFPAIYRQIRLPIYIVLAFSMTVVDVAVILGPNTPPTLSVQLVRWMADPDLSLRLRAAAAAVVQFGLVAAALLAWRVAEGVAARAGAAWLRSGRRGPVSLPLRPLAAAAIAALGAAVFLGLIVLALWSVAGLWSFPFALPESLTVATWARQSGDLAAATGETLLVAGLAASAALVLSVGCLEAEFRHGLRPGTRAMWLLYLPLLVPQVAFLPGLQVLFLQAGIDAGHWAVAAAHLVFVFPYVFLSLGGPFRAWDRRYGTAARTLGAGPEGVLWRVRMPMLLAPALTAFAVGFAVSVGQYLPTLLVGGGRVETLTTEAVALAAGGDRRAIGTYALAQTAAAFVPFALALALPRLVWRDRRGMRDG